MIKNDQSKGASLKQLREAEKQKKEQELKLACEKVAAEKFTAEKLNEWKEKYGGIWFLPVLDEEDNVQLLAVLKPINRHILSHASTKLEDEGLYTFLEVCMRECWLDGDEAILDDDKYFIPSAMKFNKIMEASKVAFLKG